MDQNQELITQLHDHDLRLTRVETELRGVHNEIRAQREEIKLNASLSREIQSDMRSLIGKVSELSGTQKTLMWSIGAFGAMLGILEAWSTFH